MHVHSVLGFVKHVAPPFDLRLIVPGGFAAKIGKAARTALAERTCGPSGSDAACVGIEVMAYSAPTIYQRLVGCDVGLGLGPGDGAGDGPGVGVDVGCGVGAHG